MPEKKEERPLPVEVESLYGRRASSPDELEQIIAHRLRGENCTNCTQNAGAHDAWIPLFLAALALCPNWALAARVAGCAKNTPHMRANVDPEFATAAAEAEAEAIGLVEAAAFKSAVHGDLEPVYHMGVRVGEVVKYSDKMRELLLKANLPHKYRERVSMDATVHDTRPPESPQERCEMVNRLLPQLATLARFLQAKPITDV